MKLFLETSVLTRFLLGDHPTQSPQAKLIIQKAQAREIELCTDSMVIAELTWVLRSFYKIPKAEIVKHLQNILIFSGLTINNRKIVENATEIFITKNIDFTDAYFAALVRNSNYDAILSFDHDFDKISGVKRLEKIG